MRAVLSTMVAGLMLAAGGSALGQSKSGGPRTSVLGDPSGIGRQTGPVDGRIGDRTRGPGAAEIQPDRGLVPPVGGIARGKPDSDRGHVPTNEEIAKGATPAIVELPPVPRTLEYADETVHNAHHGVGRH